MQADSLQVETASASYPIHFGRGLADLVAETVARLRAEQRPLAVLVDASVAGAQAAFLATAFGDLPRLVIPSGEGSKCFAELARCAEFLAEQRIDRSGALFAVGGGVTGDLAGFVAAAYLRGIDFYQVPTTLLAMVDSSVGGKTGINLQAGKNLFGAFHQPQAVFIDVALLETLPPREFAAGMAEVIKYGLLGEPELLAELEALEPELSPSHPALPGVIRACCASKARVVKADEREQAASGGRALLNLGHTFGHAIEAVAGYGEYLHGEAIAIGLVLATRLSEELGYLSPDATPRVKELLERNHLPTTLRSPLSVEALLARMARDKKVRQGSLKFVVMTSLGASITQGGIDPALVARLWNEVGAEGAAV
jgi:3-dehydroquinate synthase